MLSPHHYVIDDADFFEFSVIEPLMHAVLRHGDPWHESPPNTSLRNLLKQLYSLYRVTDLWIREKQDYDLIFYLRPDVWYFNDLNFTDIDQARRDARRTIYVPNFHHWSGINDRFAFGTPQVMKLYGNRYIHALNYSQYFRLHSETFLRQILVSEAVKIKFTDILFERVRSNGILWGIPVNGTFLDRIAPKYQLKQNENDQWVAIPLDKGRSIVILDV